MRISLTLVLMSLSVACPGVATADTAASASRWPALRSISMRSTDLGRSTRFYVDGLGMIQRGKVERGSLTEVMFAFAGKEEDTGLMLQQVKGDGAATPVQHGNGASTVILGVPDAVALAARLKAAGYSPGELRSMGPYRIFDVLDPDGYRYEIVQSP